MPRKNPFPKREREICNRISEFRAFTKLSRVAFAEQSGMKPDLLRSYELGRSQLNYQAAHKLIVAFAINPEWLATGNGPVRKVIVVPSPAELNAAPRALFSEKFDFEMEKAERTLYGPDGFTVSESGARLLVLDELQTAAYHWLPQVPADHIEEFRNAVVAAVEREIESYGYQSSAAIAQRGVEMDAGGALHPEAIRSELANLRHGIALDTVHASVNTGDVKAQWPLLKKRLQAATATVGTKSKLAKCIGVKLASVSQWLSDSDSQREPGAETTLQLLKWVELQERQAK